MERDLDIVLFGATGYTGAIVAAELARRSPGRWALAGRNRARLEAVRARLFTVVAGGPASPAPEILVADAADHRALGDLARRARVVCTTVGPYVWYGLPLAAACAEQGASYCDLTGEVPFIRALVDAHHERAIASRARIVPCCGFDSIPSDLGVLLLHEALAARGERLVSARFRLVRARGRVSGGTAASMIAIGKSAGRDRSVRRLLADPYALNPPGTPRGPELRDRFLPRRDPATGHWLGAFVMGPINSRIVRRTNALLAFPYGAGFRYEEVVDLGRGPRAFASAALLGAIVSLAGAATMTAPGRALLRRLLPQPGTGPSAEQRASGCFRVEIDGEGTPAQCASGTQITAGAHAVSGTPVPSDTRDASGTGATAVIAAGLDPGYGATAIMLAESALCLAHDDLPARFGVLTPASAMGSRLVVRLRACGFTLDVS